MMKTKNNLLKPMGVKKVIGFDTSKPRKTYNQVMHKCFKNISDSKVLNTIYKEMQINELVKINNNLNKINYVRFFRESEK